MSLRPLFAVAVVTFVPSLLPAAEPLQVGFGQRDLTPDLKGKPVYMAGFGQNRKATSVNDPIMARAVVLRHGDQKIAIASADVVGLFRESVERIRAKLPGYLHVVVSSTHNHEGPDTLGIWGPNPFTNGVDPDYLTSVEEKIAQAIRDADSACKLAATAKVGTLSAPELVRDTREPQVKHDELVVLHFLDEAGKSLGLVVQWNCHPETLGDDNTALSADYVGYTVKALEKRYGCPVTYLTGTVGGLMTTLGLEVKTEKGEILKAANLEKTDRYGVVLAEAAMRAIEKAVPAQLTPFEVRTRECFLPLENKGYLLLRQVGVLNREAFLWTGDPYRAEKVGAREVKKPICVRTEVSWLKLGELEIAAIPGEIYPELVLDRVQTPADPGADFPDAPTEPAIYKQMKGKYRMLIGLAGDEIGYIIPRRQWDAVAPFCYGRKSAQYGEVNSLGSETAPLLCRVFQEMLQKPR